MSAQLPAHASYKKSGVALLGEVPSHWKLQKAKHLSSRISSGKTPLGGSETYVDEGVTFLRSQNVYDDGLRLEDVVFIAPHVDDAMAVSRVNANDILLNITGASIGRTCMIPRKFPPANVNQHVCVIRLADLSQAPFVGWSLKSSSTKAQIDLAQNGAAREGLNFAQVGELFVVLPPVAEQRIVAKFLDYETAKIDALIEKQQQLIALLKEKRQAVISRAVTKGLNPDAPMRDSGVEWLGEVPAHWEVKRLKHLFAEPLRNGVSPQAAETGGVPTFSIAAVRDGVVDIGSHVKHADISAHAAHPYRVQQGDVMMMRGNGSRDLVGSVGIVNAPPPDGCIYPDILIRLRFSEEIDAQLAVLFLNSTVSRPQVAMGAKTAAGIWKVSGATVAEFAITLPPPDEQAAIRDHLNLALRKVNDLVAFVESQGALLRERRTALISAAVTGKIDVRGWKAPESETEAEVA